MELTTGLRRVEICGLKWEDYNADMQILSATIGGGKRQNDRVTEKVTLSKFEML